MSETRSTEECCLYMLSYDLNEDSNYSRLLEVLHKKAKPLLKSQWLICSSNTPRELKEYFRSLIDDDCDEFSFLIRRIRFADRSEFAVHNLKIPKTVRRPRV